VQYWAEVVLTYLFTTSESEISIDELSAITSMTNEDILHTLHALDLVRYYNGQYVFVLSERHEEQFNKSIKKRRALIDPSCIQWKPPVFSASQLRYI
jgi:histone acetyltransferase HTATIP